MIWLWILLSVALTAFLLKGKKIAPHNFIWALMPIDRFGITLAGFTIKPVFIFSVLLVGYAVITRRFRLKIPRSVFVMTPLFAIIVVLAALFRGNPNVIEDVKIYGIFFITIACAASSLSLIEGRDDLRQIQEVMISTAVGYGSVFLALFILSNIGIVLPDVNGLDLMSNSIFKLYNTVTDGVFSQATRLRGFYLEPNSSSTVFIIGFVALLGKWIKERGAVRNIIYTLIIVANIVLTSSRSALIILILLTVISVFRLFTSKVQSYRKLIFIGTSLTVLFGLSAMIIYNNRLFSYVYDNLIAGYLNRTELNDTYGRFTIWKNALEILFEGNWISGLGTRTVHSLLDAKRDAHNTIIEVLCTSGIFAGVYYMLYFTYPLVFAIKRRLTDHKNAFHLTTFSIAYLGILILLMTITNMASVYLIYVAFLLFIIPGCLAEEDDQPVQSPVKDLQGNAL